MGMSGPTFYYAQDKDTVEEKLEEDEEQRATAQINQDIARVKFCLHQLTAITLLL